MKTHLLLIGLLLSCCGLYAQDSCENAEVIELGLNSCSPISGAFSSELDCVTAGNADMANWFSYTAEADENVILTTSLSQNAGWDSRIHVLTGDCGSALTCVATDDDGGDGFTSQLYFDTEAGVEYFIVLDDNWSVAGGAFFIGDPADIEDGTPPDPDTLISFSPTNVSTGGECVVDMNGDFLDDIVNVSGSTVTVLYQQPDGTFEQGQLLSPTPDNNPSWSITAGDLDNNGFNDLMYGGGGGVSIMMRSDDGMELTEFSDGQYVFSQRGNMADVNMDGILDAFMCHDVDANVFYISDGNGDFEYFQGGLGENGGNYGSVWIDYNNDCLLDMFIAKCGSDNINQMHRNNGDGTYTQVGPEINLNQNVQTWSSAWADYDNDGDMDVFVGASSTSNGSHLLMRNDDGIFVDVTAEAGILASFQTGIEHSCNDFNNDGFVDIDLAGNTILVNNGDMTFTQSNVAMTNGPVGDLNDDGYLDVVNAWSDQIYFNQETGNNYLKINTIGVESNKNGVGARITIESAMGTQIRDVKSGDGFAYMSSITAHFGLGQDTEVDRITVHWPSGNVTVVESPEINTTHNIVEVDGTIVNVEEVLKNEITVFPNPTADYLNISSETNFNSLKVEIVDLKGATVLDSMIKDNRVNVSDLETGTYFARIFANGTYAQFQFVKE